MLTIDSSLGRLKDFHEMDTVNIAVTLGHWNAKPGWFVILEFISSSGSGFRLHCVASGTSHCGQDRNQIWKNKIDCVIACLFLLVCSLARIDWLRYTMSGEKTSPVPTGDTVSEALRSFAVSCGCDPEIGGWSCPIHWQRLGTLGRMRRPHKHHHYMPICVGRCDYRTVHATNVAVGCPNESASRTIAQPKRGIAPKTSSSPPRHPLSHQVGQCARVSRLVAN